MGSSATYLLRHQDGRSPAALVQQFYGGTLITVAGIDPCVAGLGYIAALVPDANETSQSQQAQSPVTDVFSHIDVADCRVWLKRERRPRFGGDGAEGRLGNARRTGGGPLAQISFIPRMRGIFRIML
jgi:hypothetical protein